VICFEAHLSPNLKCYYFECFAVFGRLLEIFVDGDTTIEIEFYLDPYTVFIPILLGECFAEILLTD